MGQIISIILNFIFPKAETVVPAQNQPNLAVIDDEEPLLTENPFETNPTETNPVQKNLEESFKTTSSEHPSSDSNLSFQAPLEGPNPDHFSFDPKNYEDVAKVLDETIELLKGGKKEVLENVVKIDAQLVENIIEASGESHGSSSVATRDTKDFLFSNEKLEVRDGLDEDSLEIKGIQDEFRKLIENGDEEEDSGNFQRAMEKTDEMLENIGNQVTETEKENEEYENVEKIDKIDETDPEIMQEELNVVTNRVFDEQNTLELLQATLDDDNASMDDKASMDEPESNDVLPDLPVDSEVSLEDNTEFIKQLSHNIAKHTIQSGVKQVFTIESESMHVNAETRDSVGFSQDGLSQEIIETAENNVESVEDNEENDENDENADPKRMFAGKVGRGADGVVLNSVAGVN